VGPNGAGKTTSLSMAVGLLPPDDGSARVFGIDVWADPVAAKRLLGVLPDNLALPERLTGRELLTYLGRLGGLSPATVAARAQELLEVLELTEAERTLVVDYSAGMRKKITLATALLHTPRLLVLDEPSVSAATIRVILQRFVEAGGSVVLSSHVMALVEQVCDHVGVIAGGRLVASGTLEQVRGQARWMTPSCGWSAPASPPRACRGWPPSVPGSGRRTGPGGGRDAGRPAPGPGPQLARRVGHGGRPPGHRAGVGVGTLLLGLVRFEQPSRMVDLLAALGLAWLVGWVMGPIVVRGAGVGLRPEWFALSPLPPRRLAAGLLGASLVGFAPAVTLVAFAALVVAATRLGVVPVLVAVPATLPQLGLVVGSSRVVVTALAATLSSRRGQELGGLLMAVTIALASGGWSLAAVLGQQLATGPSSALATALRMLPSGWAPVAVAAADRSDWPLVAAALGGLAALCGLLPAAWARLLPAVMRRPAGRAPRTARRGRAAGDDGKATTGPRPGVWPRLVPAGPTGAVVAKELHTWRRDPGRTLLLLLALLISGLSLAVPAVAFDLPAALPWVGPATALIIAMGAANLYGEEGTALWLTRMIPGSEPADVRGRQAAWLLVVTPVTVVPTVVLTVLSGQGWAWPWVLAVVPAILGGTAGLMMWLSVTRPVRQKDPHRRAGPFDTGEDPNAAGALIGHQYLMLGLAALTAVPAATLVLLGTQRHQPALQAAGVLVGAATGVLLSWSGGHLAARRLADRGAELLDLLHLGPPGTGPPRRDRARPGAGPPAVPGPRRSPRHPVDRRDPVHHPPGPGPDRLQPARRRPPGQGLVRRPLPSRAPPDPGGGHLHRRRRPRPLVGHGHPAQVHGSAVMRWLRACGTLFVLALVLFVVPASAEGPVLVGVSAGHGLSLVDVAALVPLLAGTGLLAGGLWRRRQALDAALSRRPWLARADAAVTWRSAAARPRSLATTSPSATRPTLESATRMCRKGQIADASG
jgi:ABC-2 type transport system permease protein